MVMAEGNERDVSKQLCQAVDMKTQIAVEHLSVNMVSETETSVSFIHLSNRGLVFSFTF